MHYFTWKLELVSNIVWLIVGTSEFFFCYIPVIIYRFAVPQLNFCAFLRGLNRLIFITSFFFLFMRRLSLDEVHREVWADKIPISAQRGLSWQNTNSYIQPTDLFCNLIFNFCNSNMLTSFNPLPLKSLERC